MKFDFRYARTPEIVFGAGNINILAEHIQRYGSKVLIITGSKSFRESGRFDSLIKLLEDKSMQYYHREISGEPSVSLIDTIVTDFSEKSVDVVVAIGGGSVLDAGKAVSAMLGKQDSIVNYLEGVGNKSHDGTKLPFMALPTTAGTGSEATKNAVISQVGENGFKKSLRHNNFVPDIAIIDPQLSLNCPPDVTAACGMDAFTQLLESYVSTNSSPLTDALALDGIKAQRDNLVAAVFDGSQKEQVRAAMSYSALLSGIALANAGLGIVHGLAGAIGSLVNIPHGVVCGTLIGAATKVNIANLSKNDENHMRSLEKYADIGRLLSGNQSADMESCCQYLIEHIEHWIETLKLPRLGSYGLQVTDVDEILQKSGDKFNPVELDKENIQKILLERF